MPVSNIESIMANGRLAVTLVRPNGEILYESPIARSLLAREFSSAKSLLPFLAVPSTWENIVQRAERGESIKDEPILLEIVRGVSDLCYLTVLSQRDTSGELESLLCVWAARQNALSTGEQSGSLHEYTRELEGLLEHRTYQHLLTAEQNEFAQQVLDILSVGLLILNRDGDVVYRNMAMTDTFGFKPAEYLQPNIHHFMPPPVWQSFREVVEHGMRLHHFGTDPGGTKAFIDILPVEKAGMVQRVVMLFTRPQQKESDAA